MSARALRGIGWLGLGILVLGSGPCPACYDDACSPRGETYCRDGVAFYCAEPNENGAYALLEDDCAADGRVCVVRDGVDGEGPRAVCAPRCDDAGVCVDAGACSGDTCLPTDAAAPDATAPDAAAPDAAR